MVSDVTHSYLSLLACFPYFSVPFFVGEKGQFACNFGAKIDFLSGSSIPRELLINFRYGEFRANVWGSKCYANSIFGVIKIQYLTSISLKKERFGLFGGVH